MGTIRPVVFKVTPPTPVDPWNPLNLNPYTIRVEIPAGGTLHHYNATVTQISSSPNVCDVTYNNNTWTYMKNMYITDASSSFDANGSNLKILGINSTGVTNMEEAFAFDLSMLGIRLCGIIPLFDTTQLTNVKSMFRNNYYVEGGTLALYQQMSTQTNVPSDHSSCFESCGSNTTTGASELSQIPGSWGGSGW